MATEVVVWNGTLERQAIEAQRVYASAEPVRRVTDRVREWLHAHGQSTIPEIAAGIGVDQGAINTALYNLRHAGVVEVSPQRTRTAYGRLANYYRLREAN